MAQSLWTFSSQVMKGGKECFAPQRQSLWTFSKSGSGKECLAPQRQSLWTFSKSGKECLAPPFLKVDIDIIHDIVARFAINNFRCICNLIKFTYLSQNSSKRIISKFLI